MTPEIQRRVLEWCEDLFKYTGHDVSLVHASAFTIPTSFINQLYNLTIDDVRALHKSQEKD